MAKFDPQIVAHLEWIGFVRPTGLVVSALALVRAGAILDRRDTEGQQLLRDCVQERTFNSKEGSVPYISDFRTFAASVLGWNFSSKGYAGTPEAPIPPELEVALPEYSEVLRPGFAVRELEPQNGCAWQLLVRILEPGEDFDAIRGRKGGLEASEHSRLDRLLRQTRVPAGVLFNGRALRLLSAPYGESSGWIDFHVADMIQAAGRPISTALRLLLGQSRLLSLPRAQRLAALLHDSRKFQNEVSERLAEQVLHALYELLRGFQSAHDASGGELLQKPLAEHPDEVYRSLLTVILRLVFLLYAEERDMLPEDETFLQHYSLGALHERLREDAALFPDTMDLRYGAWAQLLVLFRMIHDGAEAGSTRLPRRHGVLFDPDRFSFLEGRGAGGARQIHERIEPPLVPDGTIYRALEKLLVLDGERISYRALDVEQIGSVYETMMGFRLETATGLSVAITSQKKHGAPTAVDLEALLRETPAKRDKWIQDRADRKITDTVKKGLVAAKSVEDLHAAILPVIDLAATPDLVPKGAMVLQPSEERRRSGSHYTPRELTEPIVRTTLEPILAQLRGSDGKPPRPAEILELKVCDPAMGSGAFLVEACRQLGDALVEAWRAHGETPVIPPDEDEVIFARRLVAQRCLYGVDKNPVAVDLAKVSLWLITLAKDHALTFLDHALRHGDSLVGLTRGQIEALQWNPTGAIVKGLNVREHVDRVFALRQDIRQADDTVSDWELSDLWDEAQCALHKVRVVGDVVLAAFFEGENARERERRRTEYANVVLSGDAERYSDWLNEWRNAETPFVPFHWELEFPEVFDRERPGFDAFVGNPPFLKGSRISGIYGDAFLHWLLAQHPESHGNADFVAHFFRRAFTLLRDNGCLGFIATNTIGQGDTRYTGLRWICTHGGAIYAARKRYKWPGQAAVVVSVVWLTKGAAVAPVDLDGRSVSFISAYLFHAGGHENPSRLQANVGTSFKGVDINGMGFTFDDGDSKGVATSLQEMRHLIADDPRNAERIFPFIGGEEVNESPTQASNRFVINFGDVTEIEARRWPALMAIVESKVKPVRATNNREVYRRLWWLFAERRVELQNALKRIGRALVTSEVSPHLSLSFVPSNWVLAQTLKVFAFETTAAFCVMQSRVHELWARFFGSSMKDDLRYTPTDCFETFPFPVAFERNAILEEKGKEYYEFRASLMVRNNEGLTKTYGRFHSRHETSADFVKLRQLHAEMDRAALDAYGWGDIPTSCEFLLDYEIDEDEWGDKKKPYRYRWPDDVRDEVLARLLELNAERANAEARSGAAVSKQRSRKATAKRSATTADTQDMFS
jgi:hypothetical protein